MTTKPARELVPGDVLVRATGRYLVEFARPFTDNKGRSMVHIKAGYTVITVRADEPVRVHPS